MYYVNIHLTWNPYLIVTDCIAKWHHASLGFLPSHCQMIWSFPPMVGIHPLVNFPLGVDCVLVFSFGFSIVPIQCITSQQEKHPLFRISQQEWGGFDSRSLPQFHWLVSLSFASHFCLPKLV